MLRVAGRGLVEGEARGRLLVTGEPISFYGGVDPDTGVVVDSRHELRGVPIAGRILVFPHGKGSTVGSYTLLRLGRRGLAPSGIVNLESEPIVVVGCVLAGIPLMDRPEVDLIERRRELNNREAILVVEGGVGRLEVMDA